MPARLGRAAHWLSALWAALTVAAAVNISSPEPLVYGALGYAAGRAARYVLADE